MLTETAEQDETEVLDETEVELETATTEEGETTEPDAATEPEGESPEGEDDDVVDVITLDGEPIGQAEPDETDSAPIKQIRQEYRELSRKYKELERQVKAPAAPAQEVPTLGPKPTLESVWWDTDAHEAALDQWYEQKRKVEAHLAQQEAAQQSAVAEITQKIERYHEAKKKVRIPDFEDAENAFADAISDEKRGLFLKYADNPEHIVYAIGKSPELRAKFAAIDTPGQLIKEIAVLETRLKVSKAERTNKVPPPEKPAPAGGSVVGGVDETLAKLEQEADRTGDRSKIIAYKAKLNRAKS